MVEPVTEMKMNCLSSTLGTRMHISVRRAAVFDQLIYGDLNEHSAFLFRDASGGLTIAAKKL